MGYPIPQSLDLELTLPDPVSTKRAEKHLDMKFHDRGIEKSINKFQFSHLKNA